MYYYYFFTYSFNIKNITVRGWGGQRANRVDTTEQQHIGLECQIKAAVN